MIHFQELTEAFDTPTKITFTRDSKLPLTIYGRFEINGKEYALSMIRTGKQGVYQLSMGKMMSNNVMWWRYHSPRDIVSAIATLLDFANKCIIKLGAQLKGVVIKVRGDTSVLARVEMFTDRIIKKKFASKLKYVYVNTPEDETSKYRYVFIVRKNVQPATLFTAKDFKGTKFEDDAPTMAGTKASPIIPDVLDTLKPKIIRKKTISTKPSKDFTNLADFETDGTDFNSQADALKKSVWVEQDDEKSLTKHALDDRIFNSRVSDILPDYMSYIKSSSAKEIFDGYVKKFSESNESNVMLWTIKNVDLKKTYEDMIAGFTSQHRNKIKNDDFSSRYAQMVNQKFADHVRDTARVYLFEFMQYLVLLYINEHLKEKPLKTYRIKKTATLKPMMPSNLQSKLGSVKGKLYGGGKTPSKFEWETTSEMTDQVEATENYLANTANVFENFSKKEREILYDYTNDDAAQNGANKKATSYVQANSICRTEIKNLITGKGVNVESLKKSVLPLWKLFKKTKPHDDGLWLFRKYRLQEYEYITQMLDKEPGDVLIDPAFLSTSIDPDVNAGPGTVPGMLRVFLKIYAPKNSTLIPILNESSYPEEKEVLLPPMSVLRITDIEITEDGLSAIVTAIYEGSAFASAMKRLNLLEEQITSFVIMLKESVNSSPNTNKFDSPFDTTLSKKIEDEIKKGVLKVKK